MMLFHANYTLSSKLKFRLYQTKTRFLTMKEIFKTVKPFFMLLFCFQFLLVFAWSENHEGGSMEEKCLQLTGRAILPGQKEYDKARLVSNYYSSKNSHPDVIVYCKNSADVQNAIKWAICNKLAVRIRSGGHNHEGFSTGNGLVIDVSEMKDITVDEKTNIATVKPGVKGSELYNFLYKKGLTQVGGTCADVGISGLILTGGMGPLLRKHGLACDNLLALEMVDAKGDILHVTKDNEHKDLFWACCGGGGGNFGVVTSIVLKVYPVEKVTWFNLGWNLDQPIEEIIHTWQKLFADGNKKWFSHLDLWSQKFPSDKLNQSPIKVLGVYYGSPEEAKKDLEPFLKIGTLQQQTIESREWVKVIQGFEEATAVYLTDKPEYKSTGAYAMKPLPVEATDIIVKTLKNSSSPYLNVLLFSMGGESANIPPDSTAYFYRQAAFFVVYSTQWLKASDDKNYISEIDVLRQKLIAYTEGDYVGNPDRNLKDYLKAYYGNNVERLRQVKLKYDKDNLFRFEQGIR